jgi:hypothetical protein
MILASIFQDLIVAFHAEGILSSVKNPAMCKKPLWGKSVTWAGKSFTGI